MQDLPSDVALDVRRVGRWRVICASYRGLQHVADGSPRQDAFALEKSGEALNIAVADGLGSADLSHIGAQLACQRGVRLLSESPPRVAADFHQIYDNIHCELLRSTGNAGTEPRQLATTLQLLRIDAEGCWYARLGDGGCVLVDSDRARWLGGVDAATAGVSNLSDPKSLLRLECDGSQANGITGFLIFSDGLEDIFLDAEKHNADEANVRKIIELVRKKHLRDLVGMLNNFLSSDFDRDLRDDKTIVAGALENASAFASETAPAPEATRPVAASRPFPLLPAAGTGPVGSVSSVRWIIIGCTGVAMLLAAALLYRYAAGPCAWPKAWCPETNTNRGPSDWEGSLIY